MPYGACRLCGNQAELQLSHVIPAFVYRWFRESSGSGHIRSNRLPNRRVQDGPKEYWLCAECEGRFSRLETAFANNLFYPYLAGSGQRFRYSEWLLQFCVSVSWRVLHYFTSREHNLDYGAEFAEQVRQAEGKWREFLLGQAPHPGEYRQHLIPLDRIENTTMVLPPNINRYLMRTIHIDLCRGDKSLFVYSKLGRFIILGFVNEPNQNRWVGSGVHANQGTVEPRKYSFPSGFGNYILDKAKSTSESLLSISDRQQQKIEEAFYSNVEKIAGSDLFKAMQADVEMFGEDAFIKRTDDGEKDKK